MRLIKDIHKNDILIFFQQLSTLIIANVPLMLAIEVLEKSQIKTKLRIILYEIKRELLAGKLLSQAFSRSTLPLDFMTIRLLEIAEQTGRLDTILTMITIYLEKKLTFQTKLKQSLMYPTFIFISAMLLFFTLLFFIIPKFAELYSSSNVKLPLFTQIIFSLSAIFSHIYLAIFLIPILFGLYKLNYIKLKPEKFILIERHLRKVQTTSFIRNLAITLSAGLSIMSAIKISSAHWISEKDKVNLNKLIAHLQTGMNLHHAMELTGFFPPHIVQMVKIGEESGKLDHMLHKSADYLEADIERTLAFIQQLLEPLIMLILGALIGGLVIAMYLPIFSLGTTL